jgi:ribosome maturation factor RimP
VSREAAQVERLIAPSADAMGYALVQVRFIGGSSRPTLQVMAERKDGVEMTVDDCADLSRAVSALLDVEDPVPGAYRLEVSSPGIDRPLVRLEDYQRFAGHEARVETERLIDGRKRFKGKLLGVDEGRVRMSLSDTGAEAAIPFADVSKAKLVLTDELIAQSLKRRGG